RPCSTPRTTRARRRPSGPSASSSSPSATSCSASSTMRSTSPRRRSRRSRSRRGSSPPAPRCCCSSCCPPGCCCCSPRPPGCRRWDCPTGERSSSWRECSSWSARSRAWSPSWSPSGSRPPRPPSRPPRPPWTRYRASAARTPSPTTTPSRSSTASRSAPAAAERPVRERRPDGGCRPRSRSDRACRGSTLEGVNLQLHDTATRRTAPLIPVREGAVSLYVSWPTTQGARRLGYRRTFLAFDVLVRWLERSGYEGTHIRNVTDIEDKILTKSAETGTEWWAWSLRFEREFKDVLDAVGNRRPTYEPRATGHVTEMVALMQRLIERGHAYADGSGSVYFDVASHPTYGSLTRQSLDDMQDAGEEMEEGKRD